MRRPRIRQITDEAELVDRALYAAVARTSTPHLDAAMRVLSRAADHSKLSMAVAGTLALAGGQSGRRAARVGLACVAVTSAASNVVVKPLARRRRPAPRPRSIAPKRRIPMPRSRSFPSGHTATAVAFASAVGRVMPGASAPLHALAALVGYSRVHTGVHYPADVVSGALLGEIVADLMGPMSDVLMSGGGRASVARVAPAPTGAPSPAAGGAEWQHL